MKVNTSKDVSMPHCLTFYSCTHTEPDAAHLTTLISWPPTADEGASYEPRTQLEQSTFPSRRFSKSRAEILGEETQESQFNYSSDASSVVRFPTFHFDLHRLTPLSSMSHRTNNNVKISVLLAVLEIDGPDSITLKKGKDAGKEISLLKMVLGDEAGNVGKLTAWREVAENWGNELCVKRGDVVLIESKTPSSICC